MRNEACLWCLQVRDLNDLTGKVTLLQQTATAAWSSAQQSLEDVKAETLALKADVAGVGRRARAMAHGETSPHTSWTKCAPCGSHLQARAVQEAKESSAQEEAFQTRHGNAGACI